jgi:hypothetical protein
MKKSKPSLTVLLNLKHARFQERDSLPISFMQRRYLRILLLALIVMFTLQAGAQKPAIFSTSEGAVNGYDVVAYFKQQAPVKGADSLSFAWHDADWKFSTRANLDSFRNDPTRYAPKYGGYCAFGVSGNYKAPTSADAWTIINNELYLNYNKTVQASWKKEMDQRIRDADKNWPGLVDK